MLRCVVDKVGVGEGEAARVDQRRYKAARLVDSFGQIADDIRGRPDHRRVILAGDGEAQGLRNFAIVARLRLEGDGVGDALACPQPVEGGAVVAHLTGRLVEGDETIERTVHRRGAGGGDAAGIRDIILRVGRVLRVGIGDRHIVGDIEADRRGRVDLAHGGRVGDGDGRRVVAAGDSDNQRAGRLVACAAAIVGDGVVEGFADRLVGVERLRVRIGIIEDVAIAAVILDEQVAIFARDLRFAGLSAARQTVKDQIGLRIRARRALGDLERGILGAVCVEPVAAIV